MKKIYPIKSLTREYILSLALAGFAVCSIFYFTGLMGIDIYTVYAASLALIIILDRYGLRGQMLALGVIWTLVFIILFFMGIVNKFRDIAYEIPGAVIIFISIYNWGAGPDLSHKQEYPIENEE